MSTTEELVRAIIARCARVSAGVDELMPRVGPILAALPTDLNALQTDDRTAAVAYIKRFEQLQDLAQRLTRAVAAWELVDARELTLRDLGDWLEKIGLLDDAVDWMNAARLRNRLVHEYPIEESEQIARLCETGALMPRLQEWVAAFTPYLRQKGFPV